MVITDNIGVQIKSRRGKQSSFASGVMKEQDTYLVPLESAKNVMATPVVSIGDNVKEGTLIGKPKDRYGAFVYSPVSGKVTAILQQLSLHGTMADHVLITADKKNEVERFKPVEDFSRKSLLERLMISGCMDEDGELCYIKYIRKSASKKPKIIVSCVDNDPYQSACEVLMRENTEKIVKGALEFKKLAEAATITFVFQSHQKSAISAYKKYVKSNKLKDFYIEIFPDLYPLTTMEVVRYISGKTLDASGRFQNGLYVESVFSCKEFFEALNENKPVTEKLITIGGEGFARRGNFVVKVGTKLQSIMDFVGTPVMESQKISFKIICGGSMSGIAEESANVAIDSSLHSILFLTAKEFADEKEYPCNHCGKCADVCPAKIMPYKIEEFLLSNDLDFAKSFGIEACTSCGACSYVCPARRYLAQRITNGKHKLESRGEN